MRPPREFAPQGVTHHQSARDAPANVVIQGGQRRKNDAQYDGAFVGASSRAYSSNGAVAEAWSSKTSWRQLTGTRPNNGRALQGKALYVNGMNTPLSSQAKSMQHIANSTGKEVIGIHNATHGFLRDGLECTTDKMNVFNNGSHRTLTEAIYQHVKTRPNEPLDLVAHSQGGIITSRALHDVKNRLRREDGLSKPEVEQALSNVRIQTAGAAAVSYPTGPKYLHHVNTKDMVPQTFGGTAFGWLTDSSKDKHVHRFSKEGNVHSMNQTYASELVPFQHFDRARAMLEE